MFKEETKELKMSNEFKKKIEMICKFACVKYELVNGNIISIKNTNLAYVKPHILKVKGNDYLLFEDFKKELNDLNKQIDRIKTAYIKGITKIDYFEKELNQIEFRKQEIENKIKEQKQYDNLSFTLDDLIIFEDNQTIDILNNPFNYLSLVSDWIILPRK